MAERVAQLVLARADAQRGPPSALLLQAATSQKRLHGAMRMLLLLRGAERLGGAGRAAAAPPRELAAAPDCRPDAIPEPAAGPLPPT
jgi:hypothetical protein